MTNLIEQLEHIKTLAILLEDSYMRIKIDQIKDSLEIALTDSPNDAILGQKIRHLCTST